MGSKLETGWLRLRLEPRCMHAKVVENRASSKTRRGTKCGYSLIFTLSFYTLDNRSLTADSKVVDCR